jgi:hypothetical protein
MTRCVVATKREHRGHVMSARDALARVGFTADEGISHDLVIIDLTPQQAIKIQAQIGDSYYLEPEILHQPV